MEHDKNVLKNKSVQCPKVLGYENSRVKKENFLIKNCLVIAEPSGIHHEILVMVPDPLVHSPLALTNESYAMYSSNISVNSAGQHFQAHRTPFYVSLIDYATHSENTFI